MFSDIKIQVSVFTFVVVLNELNYIFIDTKRDKKYIKHYLLPSATWSGRGCGRFRALMAARSIPAGELHLTGSPKLWRWEPDERSTLVFLVGGGGSGLGASDPIPRKRTEAKENDARDYEKKEDERLQRTALR